MQKSPIKTIIQQFSIKKHANGNIEQTIEGFSSLDSAKDTELSFFSQAKYKADLENTQAAAVLMQPDLAHLPSPPQTCRLYVQDPQWLFCQILNWWVANQPTAKQPAGIQPNAIVDKTAIIGTGVSLGHFSTVGQDSKIGDQSQIGNRVHIGDHVEIGQDCQIHAGVVLYDQTKIGNQVIIQANTVVGADGFGYLQRRGKHVKIPQIGRVVIEDQVEIGANTCIDRAALTETYVGTGTKVDNLCQIAHGVKIGKHAIVCGQAGLGGSTVVEDKVVIAAQAGVKDHCHIGEGAVLLGASCVFKDVPKDQQVFGFPAQEKRQALRQMRQLTKLAKMSDNLTTLLAQLKS